MFLYTPGGRDILGVSDSQMQSELADSLIAVNEAMVNSDIDLQFSLVRVEQVSLSLLKDSFYKKQHINNGTLLWPDNLVHLVELKARIKLRTIQNIVPCISS